MITAPEKIIEPHWFQEETLDAIDEGRRFIVMFLNLWQQLDCHLLLRQVIMMLHWQKSFIWKGNSISSNGRHEYLMLILLSDHTILFIMLLK